MMQNASYLCIAKRVTGHGVNSNQLQNILQVFLKFLLTKQKFHCIISPVSYTGNFQMRKWRNWQTRRLQVPVVAIPCGFKSHLPHFLFALIQETGAAIRPLLFLIYSVLLFYPFSFRKSECFRCPVVMDILKSNLHTLCIVQRNRIYAGNI